LERLFETLHFLEIDCGFSISRLEELILETLSRNAATEAPDVDWHIRCDVSRGPLELYSSVFPQGVVPTVIISCWPLIKHMGRFAKNYDTGVPIIVSSQRHLPASLIDPRAKTRSRVHYQLAQLEAQRKGRGNWPVLLDPEEFLTEGPSWNIFLVKAGRLLTPESHDVLHGVSRSITIEVATELGIPVIEARLDRSAAEDADEIFCTATSFGLVHAASFEGRPLGDGAPGPIHRQLLDAWKKVVGLDFVVQARSYALRVDEWEAKEREAAVRIKSE
jgi:branched-chain amino acid aminotransferase